MESKPLGESRAKAGQLLSLYVESETLPLSATLYVLKDFNLSEEMANYFEANRNERSESAMGLFTEYLKHKGLVEEPYSEIMVIGQAGRPPRRMINEWKFRRNPTMFLMERIHRMLHTASLYLFTHDGTYLILLDHGQCPEEVILEISHKGEPLGRVHLDVMSDTPKRVKINNEDLNRISTVVQKALIEKFPKEELTVSRIWPHFSSTTKRFELVSAQPA